MVGKPQSFRETVEIREPRRDVPEETTRERAFTEEKPRVSKEVEIALEKWFLEARKFGGETIEVLVLQKPPEDVKEKGLWRRPRLSINIAEESFEDLCDRILEEYGSGIYYLTFKPPSKDIEPWKHEVKLFDEAYPQQIFPGQKVKPSEAREMRERPHETIVPPLDLSPLTEQQREMRDFYEEEKERAERREERATGDFKDVMKTLMSAMASMMIKSAEKPPERSSEMSEVVKALEKVTEKFEHTMAEAQKETQRIREKQSTDNMTTEMFKVLAALAQKPAPTLPFPQQQPPQTLKDIVELIQAAKGLLPQETSAEKAIGLARELMGLMMPKETAEAPGSWGDMARDTVGTLMKRGGSAILEKMVSAVPADRLAELAIPGLGGKTPSPALEQRKPESLQSITPEQAQSAFIQSKFALLEQYIGSASEKEIAKWLIKSFPSDMIEQYFTSWATLSSLIFHFMPSLKAQEAKLRRTYQIIEGYLKRTPVTTQVQKPPVAQKPQPAVIPELKSEAKTEAKTEVESVQKLEPKPESQPENKPEAKPKTEEPLKKEPEKSETKTTKGKNK